MGNTEARPGALVVSLDFELYWGIREQIQSANRTAWLDRLERTRSEVVPGLLALFSAFDVRATWATVGLLMARDSDDARAILDQCGPSSELARLDPAVVDGGTADPAFDPYRYAPDLVERIVASQGQELATHTFSHYFTGDPGSTREGFGADLLAAGTAGKRFGQPPRSIVFPRNQHNAAYDEVLKDSGIAAYRGNPPAGMWRFRDSAGSAAPVKRGARFLDSYVGLSGDGTSPWPEQRDGLTDVRATVFLRSVRSGPGFLEPFRLRRVLKALRAAARRRRIVHLWWHPHNFGADPATNLAALQVVLEEASALRASEGLQSFTMSDIALAAGSIHP